MIWSAATLGLAACLGWLAWTDLRTLRLPDAGTLPLIAAGLLLALADPAGCGQRWTDHLAGAVGGYLVFWGLGTVFWRRHGVEGLGQGDAKLFAAAGAWLGWAWLPGLLLAAALGGLAQAGLSGRRRLAFGPWLAVAFLGAWLIRGPCG